MLAVVLATEPADAPVPACAPDTVTGAETDADGTLAGDGVECPRSGFAGLEWLGAAPAGASHSNRVKDVRNEPAASALNGRTLRGTGGRDGIAFRAPSIKQSAPR